MNKYYSIWFFIKGKKYCEMGTFHIDEFQADLKTYSGAYLIESNEIHDIYRFDLID